MIYFSFDPPFFYCCHRFLVFFIGKPVGHLSVGRYTAHNLLEYALCFFQFILSSNAAISIKVVRPPFHIYAQYSSQKMYQPLASQHQHQHQHHHDDLSCCIRKLSKDVLPQCHAFLVMTTTTLAHH
mgnify:CR=1 FL=1